jgi:5'-phosphate synthase pdxT subunit
VALQGDVREHQILLERLGVDVRWIRQEEDLQGVDGVIFPGGESTTQRRLLKRSGLWDRLHAEIQDGLPAYGTCAGAILLSHVVDEEEGYGMDLLPVYIRRNAWGRQKESFEAPVLLVNEEVPYPGVFIRAPRIQDPGEAKVLGTLEDGEPVLVRKGHLMISTFHPELTEDLRIHQWFLKMVEEAYETEKS